MTNAKNSSKVSTLALLIAVVSVAVSTTLSDAFVPPPSVANIVDSNRLQHNGFSTTNGCNEKRSCLFASTLPSRSGSGLAVIDSWKLLPDGRIKGVMADSGDNVLTSPLKNKNGLKEKTTVRTVSGSRYKLGIPTAVIGAGNNNLSADRLGTPRATLGGINGNNNNVRATQPLKSNPMGSQDGLFQNFLANKGRATMPLRSDSLESPSSAGNNDDNSLEGSDKKMNFFTPFVGGASAIAIGAAIGTGVVSDKGIDLDKIKNVPDPSEILKSVKSLGLPDIKSLKAPAIPFAGVSFPKFEGLPSLSVPKLPDIGIKLPNVNLPNAPDVKFPEGIKMPDMPSVNVQLPDGMKNLGYAAGGAVGNALESNGIKLPTSPFAKKNPQTVSVGQGPYRVPMPYLDVKIVEAENERRALEAAEKAQAAEREEAVRILNIRREAEAQAMARSTLEREQKEQKLTEGESRIQREADERVKKAEQEAARLRIEVEQTRLAASAKEKAAAEETARLKKEAETAYMKEQAAKEEFTRKLQEAELAKLKEAQDFAAKLADAEQAAARERALEEESIAKQRMVEEAAAQEAAAVAKVRKPSVGATAARKASYSSPSLTTYEGWQERQRTAYQTRMGSVAELKADGGVASSPYSSPSQDNLSTYKKWQQNVAAKKVVSISAEPVKAAYITGAPAPVANQLISGKMKLSEPAIALNGDLGYVISGTSALIGGIAYVYANKKIQDELSERREMQAVPRKTVSAPSTTSATVQPVPPVVPPSSMVQARQEEISSATMAIDAKPNPEVGDESASVTKEVSPPPLPKASYSPLSGPPTSTTSAPTTPDVINNQGSYLESMSRSSDASNMPVKSSFSPFSNPKKTSSNDSLYNPPSTSLAPQTEEIYEEPSAVMGSSASYTLEDGETYGESLSESGDSPKESYSPFGTPKIRSSDSLYAPPVDDTNNGIQTVVNGGSYFDSMPNTNRNGEERLKASYSPFGTPKRTTNDSLYGPPNTPSQTNGDSLYDPPVAQNEDMSTSERPMTEFPEATTSNQDSYLNAMNDSSGSNMKKSYSPFGKKPKAVSDNGLYSPEKIDETTLFSLPVSDDALPSGEEINPAPVANYLERLVGTVSAESTFGKKSFSPFGKIENKPKGQASGSDILYKPPAKSSSLYGELPSEEERVATPVPVGNYLERLIGPVSAASTVGKKSFSPFGKIGNKPKGQASGSDILYTPPAPAKPSLLPDERPSEEERDVTPVTKNLEGLVVQLNVVSTTIKKSWSPFGMKSTKSSSGTNTLYSPQSAADEYTLMQKELKIETKKSALDYIDPKQSSYESIDLIMEATEDELFVNAATAEMKRIKNAYTDWCTFYGRTPTGFRLDIFSSHYKLCEKHYHMTGAPISLNEYADWTEEEFGKEVTLLRLNEPEKDSNFGMGDNRIVKAYDEWLYFYKKNFDEYRLEIFASNFNVVEKYHEGTGEPLVLNEFSDLSKEEYEQGVGRIRNAYKEWCTRFGKKFDQTRYKIFARNFEMEESKSGDPLILNEYADISEEECSKTFLDVPPIIDPTSVDKEIENQSQNSISTEEKMLDPDNNRSFESSKTENEEENYFDCLPESPEQASLPKSLDHLPPKNLPHDSHEDISDTENPSISNLSTAESDRIRATYIDWCDNFNKESSDFRFEIFSTHYKAAEKFHEENGIPLMLNEFSDFTEKEYKTMINEVVDNNVIDPVVEERIVSAYEQWCDWYDKDFSQDRLQIFASNFLILERYHCGESGTSSMCFNEYSDLTEEEFDFLNEKR